MNTQAAVVPGVEIEQDALAAPKLRRTVDDAALTISLAALFFEDDAAYIDLALERLFDVNTDVCEDPILVGVQPAGERAHFSDDDSGRPGDQVVIAREVVGSAALLPRIARERVQQRQTRQAEFMDHASH